MHVGLFDIVEIQKYFSYNIDVSCPDSLKTKTDKSFWFYFIFPLSTYRTTVLKSQLNSINLNNIPIDSKIVSKRKYVIIPLYSFFFSNEDASRRASLLETKPHAPATKLVIVFWLVVIGLLLSMPPCVQRIEQSTASYCHTSQNIIFFYTQIRKHLRIIIIIHY